MIKGKGHSSRKSFNNSVFISITNTVTKMQKRYEYKFHKCITNIPLKKVCERELMKEQDNQNTHNQNQ